MTITGHDAIEYKMNNDDAELNKYADPVEGERFNIGLDDAHAIAAEDASLLYIEE